MPLLPISDASIQQAAKLISGGRLVAFPTETVYGLGGDAFNPAALALIFEVKNRPRFDPLIVHIAVPETLEKIADLSLLDSKAQKKTAALINQFWPGPLTLILPKQEAVPDLATSGMPTVAVRLPAHEAARQLIAASTGAIAAPSANPFGFLSPTTAGHVMDTLGEKVDLILDGGPTPVGLESTVLDLCGDIPRILRPGGTPHEAIESLIGTVAFGTIAAEGTSGGFASPGLQKSHYAPRIPLVTHNNEITRYAPEGGSAALLFFDGISRDAWLSAHAAQKDSVIIAVLSEAGNLHEASANLFDLLHKLDNPAVRRIHAQLAPEQGLGVAINDRLRRAGCQK